MRLIDADALEQQMYHEAFETDSDLQKWDSGCWIRYKLFEKILDAQPTVEPERKTGKWTDRTMISKEDIVAIEEWQSCRCSECGRYDTRPYMYFFDSPMFCSWCGAQMEEEG